MSDAPDPQYLATAVEAVLRAGESQMARFGSDMRVEKKGAIDLVTEIDIAIERDFREMIAGRFPDHKRFFALSVSPWLTLWQLAAVRFCFVFLCVLCVSAVKSFLRDNRPSSHCDHKGTAMLVGTFHFPTDYGIDIRSCAERSKRAASSRCSSASTRISRPAGERRFPSGGELPKRYSHTHDPFVALSFAAAATRTLKLGTGIALMPQRDPIITAKSVASLDQLRDGRFIFAIGGGWNVEEMENHGARYDTRFKLLRERVLAMKALWTQEEAQFHGEFVNFDPVWMYPKPKQKPHPPIFLGGETDHTIKRVVEFCDGWFPRARARLGAQERGGASASSGDSGGARSRDLVDHGVRRAGRRAKLAAYREAGIHRVLLEVPDVSRDEILRVLDKNAPLTKL